MNPKRMQNNDMTKTFYDPHVYIDVIQTLYTANVHNEIVVLFRKTYNLRHVSANHCDHHQGGIRKEYNKIYRRF